MSRIALVIDLDGFPELPVVLPEESLLVTGRTVAATIDLSPVVREAGDRLAGYLQALDGVLAQSKFRWHCRLVASGEAPAALSGNLARVHWQDMDFTHTDFRDATIEGAVALNQCRLADDLPPIDIDPGAPSVYPPQRAMRDLNLTDIREQLVLRWGLAGRGGHLAQALLWLEPRHSTRPFLEKVLARSDRRLVSIGRSPRD